MGSRRNGFTLVELMVVVIVVFVIGSIIVGGCGGLGYKLFSKKEYVGVVTSCTNLTPQQIITTNRNSNTVGNTYSFAVELRTADEIIDFSSEDRQFAVVKAQDSIRVATFKYAPWNFGKAGTLYGGRLLKKYPRQNPEAQ